MKCGREIKGLEVFCPECTAEMEKYPVKPGTPVQLPPRRSVPPVKKKSSRRRTLKPEEQTAKLRHTVRLLSVALIVVLIAFVLVTFMLLQLMDGLDPSFLPFLNGNVSRETFLNRIIPGCFT